MSDDKDLDLNERIGFLMRDEIQIRKPYNDFRVANGLEPVDFDALQENNDAAKLQLCMNCLLKAFKTTKADPEEATMFSGGIMSGIGINSHHGPVYMDEELKIPQKKKFLKNAHLISPAFKKLTVPAN